MSNQIHRSQIVEYIDLIFDSFTELRGDRRSGDDTNVIGGLARLGGYKAIVIGYQRVTEPLEPAGYRKSSRLMHMAETFNKPVILFSDIPTASSLSASGQQWVDEAIARNLEEMSRLAMPIIGVIVDGPADMYAADRVLILENAGNVVPYFNDVETLVLDVYRMVIGTSKGELFSLANTLREAILEELPQLHQVHPDALVQQRLRRLQYQFLTPIQNAQALKNPKSRDSSLKLSGER